MTTTVNVIEHSVGSQPGCKPLTSLQLYYPRAFIHEQFLTHRAISRNSESSRAKPISKVVEQCRRDPAMPFRWGVNGRGMNDHGEMSPEDAAYHEKEWLAARNEVIARVGRMIKHKTVPHKQIANRLLLPWQHISVLASATDWDNFFALRMEDAQPDIENLAHLMYEAIDKSTPTVLADGEWHLPYIHQFERDVVYGLSDEFERGIALDRLKQISAARCARVSYHGHNGRATTDEQDLATYETLVSSGHMHASPMEHQARPDKFRILLDEKSGKYRRTYDNPELHGNFTGWIQQRKLLPGNTTTNYKRS